MGNPGTEPYTNGDLMYNELTRLDRLFNNVMTITWPCVFFKKIQAYVWTMHLKNWSQVDKSFKCEKATD